MTQNDGGTPYEPKPDRETPPTQPLPDTPLGTGGPADSSSPQEPAAAGQADPGPGGSREQPNAPYGQPGVSAVSGPPGAPVASQYGYEPSPPKNDLAVWSLVTGILSFVFCPLLLGIAAIVTGTMSRKAADQGLANNRGMGTAGLILGWINVALVVLGIAFFIFALAAGLLSGGFGDWGDMNDMERYSDY
jgi:hypothetical protein